LAASSLASLFNNIKVFMSNSLTPTMAEKLATCSCRNLIVSADSFVSDDNDF